jgi:hypothetical protein
VTGQTEDEALEELYDRRAVDFLTEDTHFSRRTKPEPVKKGIGYKVFFQKDGKLYPPMVANPGGEDTPVGVWLDADAAPIVGESKTGRPQVKQGGKGTQGGSGTLAYRPGWHLGEIPYAKQFNRLNPATGERDLFPKDFVWAEVEYAADNDYQQEADAEGMTEGGKFRHSYAGLKRVPEDGFYRYRTNPNPDTDPWTTWSAPRAASRSSARAIPVSAGPIMAVRPASTSSTTPISAREKAISRTAMEPTSLSRKGPQGAIPCWETATRLSTRVSADPPTTRMRLWNSSSRR